MESLIVGLAISAVGGLTYVAYTHHKAFVPIALFLNYGTAFAVCLLLLWNLSASMEHWAITDAVVGKNAIPVQSKEAVLDTINKASKARELPFSAMFPWLAAWYAYLTILRFLPNILGLEDK